MTVGSSGSKATSRLWSENQKGFSEIILSFSTVYTYTLGTLITFYCLFVWMEWIKSQLITQLNATFIL